MSVTIDGVKLSNIGVRVLAGSQVPAAPPTRDRLVVVPGRHGAYDFSSDFDVRTFELECLIEKQPSAAELQRKVRQIAALLTDEYGRPKKVRLVFDDEPEKWYDVKISGGMSVERVARLGRFTLTLTAADPHAYAEMSAYDTQAIYGETEADADAYYANTKSFVWEYARHFSAVYNHSNLAADLVVEIEGTMLNPSITHIETGKKITLPSIFTSRKVVIDSANYTVTSNGFNILFQTNGEFIKLKPGENGFIFEADSPNATVTYKWKHKFI